METSNLWCWLCPLLTGIIAGIIGYYWGKSNSTTTNNCDEWIEKNRKLQLENDKLNSDLKACKTKLDTAITAATVVPDVSPTTNITNGIVSSDDTEDTIHASIAAEPVLNFDDAAAKAVMGKKIKADDLTVVEGIGPKISELFHNNNIKTWYSLSTASLEECQEALNSGGKRFEMHNPGSWSLQAGMAFEGKWEELAKWQSEHKGGRL